MEALSVDEIPTGAGWQYEPKWDGFRCLVFRNGGRVDLQSKSGRSLTRYFPELVEAILNVKARNFAIDGEIVVPHNGPMPQLTPRKGMPTPRLNENEFRLQVWLRRSAVLDVRICNGGEPTWAVNSASPRPPLPLISAWY